MLKACREAQQRAAEAAQEALQAAQAEAREPSTRHRAIDPSTEPEESAQDTDGLLGGGWWCWFEVW